MSEFFRNTFNKIKNNVVAKRILVAVLCLTVFFCFAATALFTVSLSVKSDVKDRLISVDEAAKLEDVDYILVLGAGLRSDGAPSDMLADRLRVSISILEKGSGAKLLLSGDNSGEHYNEVAAMSLFVEKNGVDGSLIVTDGEGFSTYESVLRAVYEHGADKIIIVTQEYHLYRALYISEAIGLEAYGVSADLNTYRGQTYRDIREHFARFKDFILTIEKD